MTKLLNFLFLTVILSTQSTLSKPQNRFSGITDDEDDVASSGNGTYNAGGGVSGDYEYGESKATTQVPVTSTKNMKITNKVDQNSEIDEILTPSIDFDEKEEEEEEENIDDGDEVIYDASENLDGDSDSDLETERETSLETDSGAENSENSDYSDNSENTGNKDSSDDLSDDSSDVSLDDSETNNFEIQEIDEYSETETVDTPVSVTDQPDLLDEDYFSPPEEETRIVDIIDLNQSSLNNKNQNNSLFSWINDFWGEKYFLAALLAGAIIGFIIISLVILFICYTVRKSDEGSYTIPKGMTINSKYGGSVNGGGNQVNDGNGHGNGHGNVHGNGSTLGTGQEYKYQPATRATPMSAAPEYFA